MSSIEVAAKESVKRYRTLREMNWFDRRKNKTVFNGGWKHESKRSLDIDGYDLPSFEAMIFFHIFK
jgi:hypothetical protein